jgi:hypothetical protein
MALSNNLISYYNFERNTTDQAGTNNGIDTLVSWKSSLTDICALHGEDISKIEISNDPSLQIAGDLTIAFQIRANTLDTTRSIIHKSKLGEFSLEIDSNGDLIFTHGDGTSSESFNLLSSSDRLTIGENARIAVERDTAISSIVIYKNGASVGSFSYSLTPATSADPVIIGNSVNVSFLGEIDELGIWNDSIGSDLINDLHGDTHSQVYDSSSGDFVNSNGYKRYSLLCENGSSGDFWTNLTETRRLRYLDEEVISLSSGGLRGKYYDNIDFTNLALTRVDPTVDFDWGNGSPDPSIEVDTFSIEWDGYLVPDYSETYTLYVGSDDGTRLYVDDTLLIDNWTDQAYNEESATISLTAGQYYKIKIEYYENSGGAEVDFHWSSPSVAYEIVPSTNLYYEQNSVNYRVYDSVSAWQTDRARDLTARQEKEILDIRGQWTSPVNQITLSGWTTNIDEDYYVVLQAVGISKLQHIYNTSTPGPFRIVSSNNTDPAITVDNLSVEIKNLQVEAYNRVVSVNTNSEDVVRLLFSYFFNNSSINPNIFADQNSGKLEIASCIIEEGSDGVLASSNNTGEVYIIDSTIEDCGRGIVTNDTTVKPTSSAIFHCSDDFVDTFPENWPRYCASDDNDVGVNGIDISPGAVEEDDWNDAFVDYDNGNYRIKSDTSVLYDGGEPNAGGSYYSLRNIPYLDVAGAPRLRRDVGALSYTDWWDYRFRERIGITVPASEVPADLTDFTLYINLDSVKDTSGLWKRANDDGSDLIVSAPDRIERPQEIVFFDKPTYDGEIWTKVDLSSSVDNDFYVYFNFNSFEEEPPEIDEIPVENIYGQYEVWSDYEAVWHLQDLNIKDSTGNGHDGTVRGAPSIATDGRFGYSIEWNETGAADEESADVGNIETDSTWTGITVESWFRKDTTGDERMICKSSSTSPADHIFALHSQDEAQVISARISTDQTDAYTFDGATDFTTGTWQFAATSWSASDEILKLYLNGQNDGSTSHTGTQIANSSQQVEIANVNNTTTNRFWEGGLDEIRVAKKEFPNAQPRLEAQYNNQTSEVFGAASPDPVTNPALEPIEDIDVQGSWSSYSEGGTEVTIDVDIPELTGKLALLIGVGNENSGTAQVSSIDLNGVSATKAGQDRHGSGYSNTSEIWYYFDNDLPSTPGTYTLTITINDASDWAATATLLDKVLQEAPSYYGNDDGGTDTISTTVSTDYDNGNVKNNVIFEVASAGDSEYSTVSSPQNEIEDVVFGTTALSTSYGIYSETGDKTITRNYEASVNRLAHSCAVFKSGEERNYSYSTYCFIEISGIGDYFYTTASVYEPSGRATVSGSSVFEIETIYEASNGITLDGLATTTKEISRVGEGGLTVAYDSDPNNDRSIEFYYTGVGSVSTSGEITGLLGVIYDVVIEPISVTYSSFPSADRDIILSYEAITTPGVTIGDAGLEVDYIALVNITEASIITLQYESIPLNDRDIEISYTASGVTLTFGGTGVSYSDLIFEVDVTPVTISYISDPVTDRNIEFTRTAAPTIAQMSGSSPVDFIELIFEVEIFTVPTFTGGEYFIEFARTMSGGVTTAGSVPSFDFVVVIFPVIVTPPTISGLLDDNIVHLPATQSPDIQIKFTFPVVAESKVEFIRDTAGFVTLSGDNTAIIEPAALFLYEGIGGITVSDTAAYSYSVVEGYIPTGGINVWHRIHPLYEYYYVPIFEYESTGVALTLQGGVYFLTNIAETPSGGIIINAPGDITSDEIQWIYKYTADGSASVGETYIFATLHYERTSKVKPFITGGVAVDSQTKNYLFVGSGLIEVAQASIHRYSGFGGITTNGISEYIYSEKLQYEASGSIKVSRSTSDVYYSIIPEVFILKAIWINGEAESKIELSYTGSGTVRLLDSSQSITYTSPYKLKIKLDGEADYYVSDYHYISTGYILTKGTAHYILQEPNAYKSSGKIYTQITSTTSVSYIYLYTGHGAVTTSGVATTSYKSIDRVLEYEGSGVINVAGISNYIHSRDIISAVTLEAIYTSGQALYSPVYIYTGSGQISIGGEADLTFKYFVSGEVIAAGSANYQYLPIHKYTGTDRIFFPRIRTSYQRFDIIYEAKLPVKKTRLTGTSDIRATYFHSPYEGVGFVTVNGNTSEYYYRPIFLYEVSGLVATDGIAVTEFLVEKFYTSTGQVNTEGTSTYSYVPIYEIDFTVSLEITGIAGTVGWREFTYTAFGRIDTFGISKTRRRHVLVVVREGAVNPEPRRIEQEPLASRNFRYDLTE